MYRSLILLAVCSILGALNAQTYEFEVLNQLYEPLTEANTLTNGEVWDDASGSMPLGFSFDYFGEPSTSLHLLDDGLLTNGELYSYDPIDLLFAYSIDLIDRGFNEDISQSDVRYVTTGGTGDQVFTLEYHNAGFYGELVNDPPSNESFISYQLRLYEATGIIEIHFGPTFIADPNIAFFAQDGPLIGLIEDFDGYTNSGLGSAVILSNDPGAPTILDSFNYYDYAHLTSSPVNGTLYRFSPMPTTVQEYGHQSLELSFDPATQQVALLNLPSSNGMTYKLCDMSGALRLSGRSSPSFIDVSSLADGIYLLQVEIDGESFTGKLPVVR